MFILLSRTSRYSSVWRFPKGAERAPLLLLPLTQHGCPSFSCRTAEQYLLCIRDSESLAWERCVFNDVLHLGASQEESVGKVKWGRRLQEPHTRG